MGDPDHDFHDKKPESKSEIDEHLLREFITLSYKYFNFLQLKKGYEADGYKVDINEKDRTIDVYKVICMNSKVMDMGD